MRKLLKNGEALGWLSSSVLALNLLAYQSHPMTWFTLVASLGYFAFAIYRPEEPK